MKTTKAESLAVESIACLSRLQVRRLFAMASSMAPAAPMAPALCRSGDANENCAEHKKDQSQRRHQHDNHLLRHVGHKARAQRAVEQRKAIENSGCGEGGPDASIVGLHVGEMRGVKKKGEVADDGARRHDRQCVDARRGAKTGNINRRDIAPEGEQSESGGGGPFDGRVCHAGIEARSAQPGEDDRQKQIDGGNANDQLQDGGEQTLTVCVLGRLANAARFQWKGWRRLRLHHGDAENIERIKRRQKRGRE